MAGHKVVQDNTLAAENMECMEAWKNRSKVDRILVEALCTPLSEFG